MLNQDKKKNHELEEQASKKVTRWILSGLGAILVLFILIGGCYVGYALQPANRHDEDVVSVHIPAGATNSQIAQILQEKKIIRNATIFNFWLKSHSATNFQAGNFYLSPSMHNKEIVSQLQGGGGRPVVGHVLIKEGQTIDSIEIGRAHV